MGPLSITEIGYTARGRGTWRDSFTLQVTVWWDQKINPANFCADV